MRYLVVNAGSSSTKCDVLDDTRLVESLRLPAPGDPAVSDGLVGLLDRTRPDATLHRIVHGGLLFEGPVVVDQSVEDAVAALSDLAPLHNRPALELLDLVRRNKPNLVAVACFDTAFFARLPPESATYALPEEWREPLGIRRFGFHGLSHSWATRRSAELLGLPASETRLVSAHLGSGASLAAVEYGTPVDTTMGYTPLEGLVMSTRSGSVDPGAITAVMRKLGLSGVTVEEQLEKRAGLLGLAGTGDLAEVISRTDVGDRRASTAYAVYLHRIAAGVAAMAASMRGLDMLTFTGGAGESSTRLRSDVCERLRWLGLDLDARANAVGESDRLLSADSRPAVAVVKAREDLEMVRQASALLGR